MDELRIWMYHHQKGRSLDELPPTSHATKSHILRAFFATNVMTTLLDHKPSVLDPGVYEFAAEDDLLVPDLGLQPIPEEYSLFCTCGKCSTVRCTCRKNGLPCCALCNCQSTAGDGSNCKNPSGCIHWTNFFWHSFSLTRYLSFERWIVWFKFMFGFSCKWTCSREKMLAYRWVYC